MSGVDYGYATNMNGEGYKQSAKIFGGYDFTPMWGIEAGYTDLRNANATFTIGPAAGTASADDKRTYIAGKATFPLNDKFSMYGKLGVGHRKSEFKSNIMGYNDSTSSTGAYAGIGAQFNLSKQVALSMEYERYSKKTEFGAKPDAFTIAARYNF